MSKRSLYLYILAFCLFVSAGIVRYFMFEEMRQFTRKVERSREVVTALATLSSHFKSAQIYSPSTEHIAENLYRSYRQDMDRVPGELDHLKRLLRDSPEQWYLIDTVDRMIRTHLEVLSGMNLVEMLRSTESWRVGLLYRINIMINQMVVRENRLLAEWRGDLDRSARISDIISFGLNGIALIVIIATFISNLRLSQRGTYLEGFLESVINTSRSGIISYDAVRERGRLVDFRVSFVNQAAENLLGISGTEVQGKQLRDLPSFVRDTGLYERFSRVAEGGAPEELEIRYDRNGQQRWLYILITRRGQGLTVSFHDISTLKDYEARLKETIRELEQSNASLEQYAYAASHDLQEPLRKIQTFGSRLQEAEAEVLSSAGRTYLDKILNSAQRMSQLIRDLLTYSSLKKQSDFRPVNLDEVVSGVLQDLDLMIAQKDVQVYREDLPVIQAIPLQMQQLFYNLLSNALKFTFDGRKPEIRISCRPLPEASRQSFGLDPSRTYFEILVADNGIGFNNDMAPQIFGLFKRLNSRETFAGSGIGLALCHRVVENHHGHIYARGEEGSGARFFVVLPAEQEG